MRSSPVIGISLGDVAGIGPEVTLKALTSGKIPRRFSYLIIGDEGVFVQTIRRLRRKLPSALRVEVVQPDDFSLTRVKPGRANLPAARAAHHWITVGAQMCLGGELDALVTAPVNKEAINAAGIKFRGATELLATLTGTRVFGMMLASPRLKVSLATNHTAIRDVSSSLSREQIGNIIRLTHDTLRRMGIRRPRIAVAALNPHGGEGGVFGDEEERLISPAIAAAARAGINVTGPVSGDAVFRQAYAGAFDGVVAMYHDQGLAPLKVVAFDEAVNLTMGLPIVRTSPDHGTAFDIAGQGIARPDSMIAAINLAAQLTAGPA